MRAGSDGVWSDTAAKAEWFSSGCQAGSGNDEWRHGDVRSDDGRSLALHLRFPARKSRSLREAPAGIFER